MEAVHSKSVTAARALLALALLAFAVTLAACGDDEDERTQVRPPVPRNISVVIGEEDVSASPDRLGAGPITLLVSNQSGAARTLSIEGPQLSRSVGPIQPEDTATLKMTAAPGELELAAADTAGLRPALIRVGPERPTAQDQLLLP
jgi:hypothetical protein